MHAASCPRCGAQAPQQTSRCRACGFVFFEERRRRRAARPGPLLGFLLAFCLIAVLVGAMVLFTRDEPAAAPAAPEPLTAERAERRLEVQFVNAGYDDTAAIRCRRAVRLAGATRCQVRYANGDTQLILVGLDERGELDVAIPYPAQRRPGG